MIFKSFTNRPQVIPAPKCREELPVYREFTDKNGATYLKPYETVNVYEKIQEASKASFTVKEFMNRYGLTQEDLPTAQVMQVIDDYTQAPESFSDALNKMSKAVNDFSLLSPEQKALFHNNVNEFLASAENGTIYDMLSLKKPVVEQKVNEVLADPAEKSAQSVQSAQPAQVDTTIVHNITEGVKYDG